MKTVVITGAGTGIGRATAERLAAKGYRTVLVGRNRSRLQELSGKIGHSTAEVCDLSVESQARELGKKLAHSGVDLLVNNAGIIERADFEHSSSKAWRSQFEVNLFGPLWLTQEILPSLYKKGSGAIVNVSSTLGIRPVPGASAYSASKAALISWTQALALEAAPKGVRVNAICPGIVDTPILTGHTGSLSEEDSRRVDKMHPLGRMGRPEEIAEAIDFLAHSPWTTGTVLVVDGGISLVQP